MKNLIESFFDLLFPTDIDKVSEEKDIEDESFSEKVAILVIVLIIVMFSFFVLR